MRWYQGFGAEVDEEGLAKLRTDGRVAEEKVDGWFVALEIDGAGKTSYTLRSERVANYASVCLGLPTTLPLKNSVLVGEILGGTHASNGHRGVVLFDCPVWEGQDVSSKPLSERREYVKKALEVLPSDHFRMVRYTTTDFVSFYRKEVANGGEGIVVKENRSKYIGNGLKLPNWYKCKKTLDGDYVIMGYEMSSSASHAGKIRNVRCGLYNKQGRLVEVMTVGSMNVAQRDELTRNGKAYIGKVIVIKGYERFPEGALRHPSLSLYVNGQAVGNKIPIRVDKEPKECVL